MIVKRLTNRLIIKIREPLLKRKLTNRDSHVYLNSPFLKINIIKGKDAKFVAKGKLRFLSFLENNSPIIIILGKNATFQIDGDFFIASGSQIYVEENGFLKIGGKEDETDTCIINAMIAVNKRVEIGKDCMITTNSYISDCNWHYVEYDGIPSPIQSDVFIGDHVWVCPGASILKGTTIGSGSIIGTKSLVCGGIYPENSLIAGIPAKVIKNKCKWKIALS